MELKVREIFYSLQGEGGRSGEPSIFIRLADCNLNCWFCFHENTKITTINGVKKIKDIKTEDIILTLDEKENIVKTNVDNVIVNEVDINDILKLSFDKTDIITTKNHPFYVKNKGWVNAEDLKLNDIIISLSKNQVNSFYMKENNPMGQKLNKITEVKDISTKSYVRLFGNKDIKNIKMYNLSCSPYSSYIANNLLVHNCDTDWSWGNMMSIEEIKEEIKNYKGKWIVWTGGEPTLQLNNDILKEFSEYKHAIETNGTNPVPTLIDYITCSPKVEVGLDKLRENFPDGVQEFRFPYDRTRKLPKISELPKSDNYYISPLFLGEKKKRFLLDERNVKDAIDYVKENPEWKFSLQIHKIINIR